MPTYEYECIKSGRRFERMQGMSDPPLEKCPECGGPARRIISGGAAVVFKGRGFYATDHGAGSGGSSCTRSAPCCGRETPCERSPRRR